MKAHIEKSIFFEAARRLPSLPEEPLRLTGHSYRVDLLAGGEVDSFAGWVVDYADLKIFFEPVRKQLDHCLLDDLPGLESDTTPENIRLWIEEQLRPWPHWFEGVRVMMLGDGKFAPVLAPADPWLGAPERWIFTFAAAQALPQLPESHPCHRLHGHTYQAEVAATDLTELGQQLEALHHLLHDTFINETPGLERATCEQISAWIWRYLEAQGIQPTLVALQETPKNRCIYRGE